MIENAINDEKTVADGGKDITLAGRYHILRRLGQGGMGSVWLAEDRQLDNRKVAIKMLPIIVVQDKRAYQQLKGEALVSLKLIHPNIVTLRAFEENNGAPFLVMDYVEGQTLSDYLAIKGKLSEAETIKLLKPIAAALDYAHSEKVIHRDVKPSNIIIRKDGHPFILDFGIAREIQESMTRVTGRTISGTLLYMSPEQLRGAPPAPAQDVYSFAVMAYECLKGEPPFVRVEIAHQILNEKPLPLVGESHFVTSIMAGLAKNPEKRPKSCRALVDGGSHNCGNCKSGSRVVKLLFTIASILSACIVAVLLLQNRSEEGGRRMPFKMTVGPKVSKSGFHKSVKAQTSQHAGEEIPVVKHRQTKVHPIVSPTTQGETPDSAQLTDDELASRIAELEGQGSIAQKQQVIERARLSSGGKRDIFLDEVESQASSGVHDVYLDEVQSSPALRQMSREERIAASRQAAENNEENAEQEAGSTQRQAGGSLSDSSTQRNVTRDEKSPTANHDTELKIITPTIVITAMINGRKVDGAIISDGTKNYQLPVRWTVQEGKTYGPYSVSYLRNGKRRYKGAVEKITASWKGSKQINVSLAEIWCLPQNPKHGQNSKLELGNGVEMEMIYCKPGDFLMGSRDSQEGRFQGEAIHRVTVGNGFWLGKYEVTQKQWRQIMGTNPSFFKGDDLPVESVSWNDAQEYIRKINYQLGCDARLPTQMEWEYACRSAYSYDDQAYSWGESLNGDLANCNGVFPCGTTNKGKYVKKTTPVGAYKANDLGFYDMHGNVWEWCSDCFSHSEYLMGYVPIDLQTGKAKGYVLLGGEYALKGGSWKSTAARCRSACHVQAPPTYKDNDIGFRLCVSVQ